MMEETNVDTKTAKQNGLKLSRILYMILYLFINRLIGVVLFFIAVFQVMYTWAKDESNKNLLDFTYSLAEYNKQIISYVGFNTEMKPWPVGDWPREPEGSEN